MMMSLVTVTRAILQLTTCVVLCFNAVGGDLCKDFDSSRLEEQLAENLHQSATPVGGASAGKYLKDPSATDLSTCTLSCCARPDCNSVFLFGDQCFLISCNLTHPEGCQPVQRDEEKFKNTLMLNLRTVEETQVLETTLDVTTTQHTSTASLLDNIQLENECDPATNQGCLENEFCDLQLQATTLGYMCVCAEGYELSKVLNVCVAAGGKPLLSGTVGTRPPLQRACEMGLGEGCRANEECVGLSTRSRSGFCRCVEGFTENQATGLCQPKGGTTMVTPPRVTVSKQRGTDLTCEVGVVSDCALHETCAGLNTRSRQGLCTCRTGFTRSKATNYCDLITESHPPTTSLTPVTTGSGSEGTTLGQGVSTSGVKVTSGDDVVSETGATPLNPGQVPNKDKKGSSSSSSEQSKEVPTGSTTPSTTIPSTKAPLSEIAVTVGGDLEIQLPDDKVTLTATTIPTDTDNGYSYQWSLVERPEGIEYGEMDGINTSQLKLSQLVAGLYTFKVTVTGVGSYGDALVNVTVLPVARQNQPPHAVVRPVNQTVHVPNDVLLDGSESTDDDKIVKYHWEQVSGPLGTENIPEDQVSKSTINLKGILPGMYKFKLTVTDSDGVESSDFATLNLIKEVDYPPKANAGSNVIISLPQNSVTLYGNASTDDKGIVSYEWIKKSDDKLTVDMTGSVTPVLHLGKLEVGDYTFTLKVTDSSGQTATADVHVFVKAEVNKPPVAKVATKKTVLLPTTTVVLDGSNSTDDNKIHTYKWEQVGGHSSVTIDNADRAVATASQLKQGDYKFKLTVTDGEGLQGDAIMEVTVKENQNHPPKANAGGDKIVHLPTHFVTLDGTQSTDDRKIVSWEWTRNANSLAAGYVLNQSDHQAVLQLTDLVAGRYIFTLEVKDAEGLSSTDTAQLIVEPDVNEADLVELQLNADISSFKEESKVSLQNQLAILLHKQAEDGEVLVNIDQIQTNRETGNMVFTFYVATRDEAPDSQEVVWSGPEVVDFLWSKIKSRALIDFEVISLDTLVCQNNCSGHGNCNQATKLCECEAFWMENFMKAHLFEKQSNCDWSILYVIIAVFLIVVGTSLVTWGCVFVIRRWYRGRPKKRHRYQLLQEIDDDRDGIGMIPKVEVKDSTNQVVAAGGGGRSSSKGKLQNTSIMMSESEFSSDEETLFINSKPSRRNGHVKNGLVKKSKRTKVRT